ncbi:helix-turn-helix domain-containing protein [Flammeovirga yaeyamensis]|uniref:Helix-turn-helix domain-containing protein n=1 Tax=Flammeovirga yaeyamensis TaxID=367791 RepID=A0AAX1NEJ0_9BACT|nr:helix-turn-helix domain-containing protein [Flammeovirga yaeyamensis]MBB3696928.1 cellulose biosynthesis protein BcsQ/DNA-binding XRE family transcriptional regulator [Flammeovirga yaeyamensis]NMF33591.1 helix-turn-helix domain-containing protein [Flammeovirga yaeyamensis]QWG05141.1 helix-turn-helix domain-containing protein [Flammeovirga yaeyamensis]
MIGDNIVKLRKKNNMQQKELAQLIEISVQGLIKWEKGKVEIPYSGLSKIADIFKVPLDYIVKGEPAHVISFINSKGGNTKSSLLRQIAIGIIHHKPDCKVLCVDTDPQQTLVMYADNGTHDNIDVIAFDSNSIAVSEKYRKLIEDKHYDYDYILVDTAGYVAVTDLLTSIIANSDVIVPITLNETALGPTISSISNIADVRDSLDLPTKIIGVRNRVNRTVKESKMPFELDGYLGLKLLDGFIPDSIQYQRDTNFNVVSPTREVKSLVKELLPVID